MVIPDELSRDYDILVTDDDEGCRESVRDALATHGYRPHVASCGREAIEYVRRHRVDVFIVDMNMPDLTGAETITIIRSEVSCPIPSILISAEPSTDLLRRALVAHIESFMPKPINLNLLRRMVAELILKRYEQESN